jgi:hypothetical protein
MINGKNHSLEKNKNNTKKIEILRKKSIKKK